MIIQVWHNQDYDFRTELYNPIKDSVFFDSHTWIFPHDDIVVISRESLKEVDIFITEVSKPSTWLGIEIWFATLYGKRIICLYKSWVSVSWSLKYVSEDFIEYENQDDMIQKIARFLNTK